MLRAQTLGLNSISVETSPSHLSIKTIVTKLEKAVNNGEDQIFLRILRSKVLVKFSNSDPEFLDKIALVVGEALEVYAKAGKDTMCNQIVTTFKRIPQEALASAIIQNAQRLNVSTASRLFAQLNPRNARSIACGTCCGCVMTIAIVVGVIALFIVHPGK